MSAFWYCRALAMVSMGGISALAITPMAPAAKAQELAPARKTLAITKGPLGLTPEWTWRPNDHFAMRANATLVKESRGPITDGVRVDGNLKLGAYSVMMDLYPMGGHFRITGGARFQHNNLYLVTAAAGPVLLEGVSLTPAPTSQPYATARSERIAPMVTVGYVGVVGRGMKVAVDAGAMLAGDYRLDDGMIAGPLARNQDLITAQRQNSDRLLMPAVYPMAQLSLVYAF